MTTRWEARQRAIELFGLSEKTRLEALREDRERSRPGVFSNPALSFWFPLSTEQRKFIVDHMRNAEPALFEAMVQSERAWIALGLDPEETPGVWRRRPSGTDYLKIFKEICEEIGFDGSVYDFAAPWIDFLEIIETEASR
jgi:hypothetical protein